MTITSTEDKNYPKFLEITEEGGELLEVIEDLHSKADYFDYISVDTDWKAEDILDKINAYERTILNRGRSPSYYKEQRNPKQCELFIQELGLSYLDEDTVVQMEERGYIAYKDDEDIREDLIILEDIIDNEDKKKNNE